MQTKDEKLDALEREFNSATNKSSGELTLADYTRRAAAIREAADPQGANGAGLIKAENLTTEKLISAVGKAIQAAVGPQLRSQAAEIKALKQSIATLEKSPQPDVAALLLRLAACEARVSACTFLLPEESRMTLNSRAQSIMEIEARICLLERKAT